MPGLLGPDEIRAVAEPALELTGADGVEHRLAVTAIPLNTHPDEVVGAVALFWPHPDPPSEGGP